MTCKYYLLTRHATGLSQKLSSRCNHWHLSILGKQFVGDGANISRAHEPREREGLVDQAVVVVGWILDATTHSDIPAIGPALAVAHLSGTSAHVSISSNTGDKLMESKHACECILCW